MGWVEITCDERDDLFRDSRREGRELTPLSGCTDIGGTITGTPSIDTEWGDPDGNRVLRDRRWGCPGQPLHEFRCSHHKWEGEGNG